MTYHPDLNEYQARQAIDLMARRMADAPQGPSATVRESITTNLLRDWRANVQGARFTVHAMYYGLANFAGKGVAR